jgi:hypothetical protein
MIEKALTYVNASGKHFSETLLINDAMGYGTHYDWRFFNLVRHGKDHEASMHHLIRAWSKFVDQEGIASWISHGSLIGWFWDGLSMPWDSDNDVQMPVMELDRFAQLYNGTLVVEDESEGTGRYLIDVSPWYIQRTRGNGRNFIDARLIDIRSGIYIDITGLAVTSINVGRVNCKNYHYYSLEQLSPMRRTLYEGVELYVPNNFEGILAAEYPQYRSHTFNQWTYNRDLRLWVPKSQCEAYKQPEKKFGKNKELTMYGACNDEAIFDEYQLTKDVTKVHEKEMDIYNQMETARLNGQLSFVDTDETKRSLADLFSTYHPPSRFDPLLPR